jgi:hypothetical protein
MVTTRVRLGAGSAVPSDRESRHKTKLSTQYNAPHGPCWDRTGSVGGFVALRGPSQSVGHRSSLDRCPRDAPNQFGRRAQRIVGRKTREERADRKRLPVWKVLRVATAAAGRAAWEIRRKQLVLPWKDWRNRAWRAEAWSDFSSPNPPHGFRALGWNGRYRKSPWRPPSDGVDRSWVAAIGGLLVEAWPYRHATGRRS